MLRILKRVLGVTETMRVWQLFSYRHKHRCDLGLETGRQEQQKSAVSRGLLDVEIWLFSDMIADEVVMGVLLLHDQVQRYAERRPRSSPRTWIIRFTTRYIPVCEGKVPPTAWNQFVHVEKAPMAGEINASWAWPVRGCKSQSKDHDVKLEKPFLPKNDVSDEAESDNLGQPTRTAMGKPRRAASPNWPHFQSRRRQ